MLNLNSFISRLNHILPEANGIQPWELNENLQALMTRLFDRLGGDYFIQNNIAIHSSAVIEQNVILKGPCIISARCFIAANSYLRDGVYLDDLVKLGPGTEIRQSVICSGSSAAHFNFIGNSIIGSHVNFEAGAVICNHYNERHDKRIMVSINNEVIDTGLTKFGALVGDHSKIGANAVLSPGTILQQGSVVKRLELVEQVK